MFLLGRGELGCFKSFCFIWLALIGLCAFRAAPAEAGCVVDQLGRRVVVPDRPERVVALAPSVTEIVFALGRGDVLRGVTRYSDYPARAAGLPRIGSYVHLDLEKIVALRPDLCLAVKDGNPRETIRRLEALGIPVYAVDPRDLEGIMDSVIRIGGLLNAGDASRALVREMRLRIERIKSLVAKAKDRPRVFCQIGVSPLVSVGNGTILNELITLAGGENLAQGPVAYPRFSREQVVLLSPDVFIITSMDRDRTFERVKAEWSRWTSIPAVRKNRIFLVDSNLFDRPTPRLVRGLEVLVRLIHPELFEAEP